MGESMDIVKRLDLEYPDSRQLYPPDGISMSDVASMISAFRGAFPSNAKPSSRAAYLFTYSGPLARADFEKALDNTEKLLAAPKDTLVATYAPWCKFCQGMEEEYEKFAADAGVPVYKFRGDEEREFVGAELNTKSFPTINFIAADGTATKYESEDRTVSALKGFASSKVAA